MSGTTLWTAVARPARWAATCSSSPGCRCRRRGWSSRGWPGSSTSCPPRCWRALVAVQAATSGQGARDRRPAGRARGRGPGTGAAGAVHRRPAPRRCDRARSCTSSPAERRRSRPSRSADDEIADTALAARLADVEQPPVSSGPRSSPAYRPATCAYRRAGVAWLSRRACARREPARSGRGLLRAGADPADSARADRVSDVDVEPPPGGWSPRPCGRRRADAPAWWARPSAGAAGRSVDIPIGHVRSRAGDGLRGQGTVGGRDALRGPSPVPRRRATSPRRSRRPSRSGAHRIEHAGS